MKRRFAIAWMIMLFICVVTAFAQDPGGIEANFAKYGPLPPFWVFVFALSGLVCHWWSEYAEGQHGLSFKNYLFGAAPAKTIKMLIGFLGSVAAIWATVPESVSHFTLGGALISFNLGWVPDSALNSTTTKLPTP